MSRSSSLSSSVTEGSSSFASSPGVGADPVMSVLWQLHRQLHWSQHKIAHRMGLPVVGLEDSFRRGSSSALVRSSFSRWAREANEMPAGVPPALVAAALRFCDASSAEQPFGECRQDDARSNECAAASQLDPALKDHFAFLRQSVGYNFMSILNDPSELDPSTQKKKDWASWFGSVMNEVFDYGNDVASELPPPPPQLSGRASSSRDRRVVPETSEELLRLHPIRMESFQEYLKYMSTPLHQRSALLANAQRDTTNAAKRSGAPALVGASTATPPNEEDDSQPWPDELEPRFLSQNFDPSSIIVEVIPVAAVPSPSSGSPSVDHNVASPAPSGAGADALRMTESLEAVDQACNVFCRSLRQVEQCLLVHVQRKSEDFFAVSKGFDSLQDDAEDALRHIGLARDCVRVGAGALVDEFLAVARLHRRRAHLRRLSTMMQQIREVKELWEYVDSWLSVNERSVDLFPVMAKVIMECQTLVYDEKNAAVVFAEVSAAKALPVQIARGKAVMVSLVGSVGEGALWTSLTESISDNASVDWGPATALLQAAATLGCLANMMQHYQQRVLDEMWLWTRGFVLTAFGQCGGGATVAAVASLASTVPHPKEERLAFLAPVKALRSNAYIALVSGILGEVQDRVTRVAAHWEVVQAIGSQSWSELQTASKDPLPPTLDTRAFFSLLLVAAQHCVRDLITVRYEENSLMRWTDACPMLRSAFHFISAMESLLLHSAGSVGSTNAPPSRSAAAPSQPGRSSVSAASGPTGGGKFKGSGELRATLIGQCKLLAQRQHTKLQDRVLQAVTTEEQWVPVDNVDPVFQEMCTELCRCDEESLTNFRLQSVDNVHCDSRGARPPGGHSNLVSSTIEAETVAVAAERRLYVLSDSQISELLNDVGGASRSPSDNTANPTAVATERSSSSSESHGFVVSHSLLLLMQTLHEYQQLLAAFPFLAFDILGFMYEALKLYDGQCAAMILGASAVDMGVLKSISLQNLALASQCTGSLTLFTELFQKRMRLLFPSDRLSIVVEQDFDRARREFGAHRDEFIAKMVTVMKDRIDQVGTGFEPSMWTRKGNEWVMGLLREMAKLQKTVRSIMRTRDVHQVMIPVVGYCTFRLREVTRAIPAATIGSEAKAQVLSDVHLFKVNTETFGYPALLCMAAVSAGGSGSSMTVDEVIKRLDDKTRPTVEAFQRAVIGW